MKLRTRIFLGFSMIILLPLILLTVSLYGFSHTQARHVAERGDSQETVYDISISESASSQGQIRLMAKDVFLTALIILLITATLIGAWIYCSIAIPIEKLKKVWYSHCTCPLPGIL